jgi:hypothetical protein
MIDAATTDSVTAAADWRRRVVVVIRKVFGGDHPNVAEATKVNFIPRLPGNGTPTRLALERRTLETGVAQVVSILRAARQEVEIDGESDAPPTDASWVDPELWRHVGTLIGAGDWDKVVREATVFFEDWVRTKTGSPASAIGGDLMSQTFKPGGPLALGTGHTSEAEGWHKLARGLSEAVRNPTGHRILRGQRNAQRYAMGVVGTVTLLLAQVRAEYP